MGHRLDRAGEELATAITLARLNRLDFVAVSAPSDLAMHDFMRDGPAGDQVHAREAIELASHRGWATLPQLANAHAALALASWRAVLSFHIGGVAGAVVIAVIVWLVAGAFWAASPRPC